jgi:rRNA maturation protein Nop10
MCYSTEASYSQLDCDATDMTYTSYLMSFFCPIPRRPPYMGEVLNQLEQEGYAVNGEDLKHVWPTRFEHVNIYGKYEFKLEDARQRNGLRQLRRPAELNP